MRILIVDDDEMVRDFLREILAGPEREFDLAPNCKTALHLAETNHYDLITLDLSLPDGYGLDILARIRRMGKFTGKVVIISGDADGKEHVELARRLNADAIFCKPFDWHDLQMEVRRYQGAPSRQEDADSAQAFRNDKGTP